VPALLGPREEERFALGARLEPAGPREVDLLAGPLVAVGVAPPLLPAAPAADVLEVGLATPPRVLLPLRTLEEEAPPPPLLVSVSAAPAPPLEKEVSGSTKALRISSREMLLRGSDAPPLCCCCFWSISSFALFAAAALAFKPARADAGGESKPSLRRPSPSSAVSGPTISCDNDEERSTGETRGSNGMFVVVEEAADAMDSSDVLPSVGGL
jgi:hypothetical protein